MVATGTWAEVPIGQVELLDAEGAALLLVIVDELVLLHARHGEWGVGAGAGAGAGVGAGECGGMRGVSCSSVRVAPERRQLGYECGVESMGGVKGWCNQGRERNR